MAQQNNLQSVGRLRSYDGKDPYIFVSYAHRDSNAVLPIIARMMADGYRVWFDEGIDPGTEWDTYIAEHIEGCTHFIAFISENYLASENCKDELNFVRDLGKPRLLVYLKNVKLPAGMQMRLGRLQAIHQYTYAQAQDFYDKLYDTDGLSRCMSPSVPADSTHKAEEAERQRKAAEEAERKRKEAEEAERQRIAEEEAERRRKRQNESTRDFYIQSGVLIKYTGTGDEVVFPDSVTSIGDYAFIRRDRLTSITIPDGITRIGRFAFSGCTSLRSITIPDSVTHIGNSAFEGCTSLTSISYKGTRAAWLYIRKGTGWDLNTGKFKVHCTDGTSFTYHYAK